MTKRNVVEHLIPQRVQKVVRRLEAGLWTDRRDVAVRVGPLNAEPIGYERGRRQRMTPIEPGEIFAPPGNTWQQRWFRVDVPAAAAAEKGRRVLFFDCRGEHTVYIDGVPWAGIDVAHTYCPLPDRKCTLWLDAGTYQTCIWWRGKAPDEHGLRFDAAWIACRNGPVWDAYFDLAVLAELTGEMLAEARPPRTHKTTPLHRLDPLARKLLWALNDACEAYETNGLEALGREIRRIRKRFPAEKWALESIQVGHSHLDLVWHWPQAIGTRKGIHTAATMLRLLERYPDFRFMWTQPWLYRQIQRAEPALFEQVREAIRAGRWEATGGLWVEADNVIPCGEALARCLVLGQRHLQELAGRLPATVWLPDVFGFTSSLPQLMKLAGVENFYTNKLDWSMVTRFPHDSFRWRGNDGSEVLTHVGVGYGAHDYGPAHLREAASKYRQAGVHDEFLVVSGAGDGGGGSVESVIERVRRMGDLAGVPKSRFGGVEAFFRRMAAVRDRLPVYQGELYLQLHRGVYTTQSETKRLYRRAERALQAWEAVRVATGSEPIDEDPWQRALFVLFHDAIPGSSIGKVYAEAEADLKAVGDAALAAAADELAGGVAGWQAFNPLAMARRAVVELPPELGDAKAVATSTGEVAAVQRVGRGGNARSIASIELPPLGGVGLDAADGTAAEQPLTASPRELSNGAAHAAFDAKGRLRKLTVDGAALELASPCGFVLYHDDPSNYDAWEIDLDTLGLGRPAAEPMALKVVERGPVRAVLRGEAAIGEKSTLAVSYVLEAGSPWLGVELDVGWREDHKLLKYHVRTDYVGPRARYGCPFGSILRPQLAGTLDDEARWEVPGSRWAAVTDEGGQGLAIVTEAKYGFSCRDGDVGLSLLRSPKNPDPEADMGPHHIRFALGMHAARGEPGRPNTAAAAEALYAPVLTAAGPGAASKLDLEEPGSLVPAWALPASGGKGWILRLHETMGGRGSAVLRLAEAPKAVRLVDLLERPLGKPRRLAPKRYRLDYGPHMVLSVLVET